MLSVITLSTILYSLAIKNCLDHVIIHYFLETLFYIISYNYTHKNNLFSLRLEQSISNIHV